MRLASGPRLTVARRTPRFWVTPASMLMVGDYRFDLECARAAGARGGLVNVPHNEWPELADLYVPDCRALHGMLG